MKIQYKRVLDLQLWHDYYLDQQDLSQPLSEDYDISTLLTLVPTPECQHTLKNLRCVFRPHRHGGLLFAAETALLHYPEPLRFWLMVRDPDFANFTNLPLTPLAGQIYYFSNRSNNLPFLTQPLPTYRPQPYQTGQLVVQGEHTWESIRDRTATTPQPNPDDWEALPRSQYVSAQDQRLRQGFAYTYVAQRADPNQRFQFSLINANQQKSFTADFTVPKSHRMGQAIAVPLNFSELSPGYYRLLLEDTEIAKFVLLDPMLTANVWGLVELSLPLVQPQPYLIRFKNRSTYWRYRHERPHGFTPDLLRALNLHYENDRIYFTQRPQGLLQRPRRLFMDGKDNLLPAPRVAQIKPESWLDPETQQAAIAVFSDVYLA
jgi:hypothetical protein